MQVRSLHEGVTMDAAREATGFDLKGPADPPVTEPPSAEELQILRESVDPEGTLRG
jgi:hypothetical protein